MTCLLLSHHLSERASATFAPSVRETDLVTSLLLKRHVSERADFITCLLPLHIRARELIF